MNSKRYAKKLKKAQECRAKERDRKLIKEQKKAIKEAFKDGLMYGEEELRFDTPHSLHKEVIDYYAKKGYIFEQIMYNGHLMFYKIIIRELKND